MKGYYKENRDACIARAKSWAAENPKKKREINKASNVKLHGTPSYQTITPEDHKYVWNQFLSDMGRAASQEERDVLCADLLDSSAAKVNTVPCAVEEFLVAYAEKELGH